MQMLTSMTKFATRRDYSLDTIKALATICVVFVHASNLYGYSNSESLLINQIYGFFGKFAALGVPLFFVVSGYLASMQYQPGFVWYKENLKKKTKTLAVQFHI
ncbi:acyltransferase family protein [Allofournierella massiliensis]|uniref:acyltransferase family protein n=1 Tax=Allofournierella massiliensis TaxID=1650663 RepID=UPI0024B19CC3|nr:acyltransferase family protein [Fournierella massiliensis]